MSDVEEFNLVMNTLDREEMGMDDVQYYAKIHCGGKVVDTHIFASSPGLAVDRLRKLHPEYRGCPISISDDNFQTTFVLEKK